MQQGLRLLVFGALLGSTAWATTFYEQPFENTVEEAPVIVRGKAGMSYANWVQTPDGTKRIYTFTELQIDEVMKGRDVTGRTLMMREMGGEKDGVGMHVAGTAQFERGEDVVAFLGEVNSDGSYDVRGMMMGKYNVERGSDGVEYLAGAGLNPGHSGHDHSGREHLGGHDDTPVPSKWSMEALRQLIRTQENEGKNPVQDQKNSKPQVVTPSASPVFEDNAVSPEQASQLQPSPRGASSILWILGGIGILIAGFLLHRRFRG